MILLSCQEDALTGFTLWAVLAVAGLTELTYLRLSGTDTHGSLDQPCDTT